MKSFAKLFLLLPLAFSMSLAGCKDKKPASSEPTSSEVATSSSEGEGSSSEEPSEPSEPEVAHYTPLEIMTFIGETMWGYVEDGDFKEADENGIIESNYTIGLEIENPEDSEECLNAALTSVTSALTEKLTVVQGPAYTANAINGSIGISQAYLITEDEEVVAWLYDYCYNSKVSVHFEAGPIAAYLGE